MTTYSVRHLHSGDSFVRDCFLRNPHHKQNWARDIVASAAVESFHKTLPEYNETRLHSLASVADELRVAHVFVKDESTRFGLPAFKILGASWAMHRAICRRLDLPDTASLDHVRSSLQSAASDGDVVRLVTCSEGNWGRACARMSAILGVPCTIYVPAFMSEYTRNLLREEGAQVKVLRDGTYDDAIAATRQDAESTRALLLMDTSWHGYEEVPQWVTDGYCTMLTETDRQVAAFTGGKPANSFFVSVGVGSWAQAVVDHYRRSNHENRIITVEPDSAASLKESLHCASIVPIHTGNTIMAGMNCGTTSKIAWPIMKDGVYAAMTVTDLEAHRDVEFLRHVHNVNAGPCGAGTLAALRKYVNEVDEEDRRRMIVVLFSTEGWRQYDIPR